MGFDFRRTEGWMDRLTNIIDSRVAFVTENTF